MQLGVRVGTLTEAASNAGDRDGEAELEGSLQSSPFPADDVACCPF